MDVLALLLPGPIPSVATTLQDLLGHHPQLSGGSCDLDTSTVASDSVTLLLPMPSCAAVAVALRLSSSTFLIARASEALIGVEARSYSAAFGIIERINSAGGQRCGYCARLPTCGSFDEPEQIFPAMLHGATADARRATLPCVCRFACGSRKSDAPVHFYIALWVNLRV